MFCTNGGEVFYGGFDIESKIYVRGSSGFDEELLSNVTMCKLRKVIFFSFLNRYDIFYAQIIYSKQHIKHL